MKGFILGKKWSQSQRFDDKEERIPVSFIRTTPCYLVTLKEQAREGVLVLKIGFGQTKNIKKPAQGELAKAGIKTPLRFLKEFRLSSFSEIVEDKKRKGVVVDSATIYIGDEIKSSFFFKKGDLVSVSGISKGKGFQGVVKRHRFAGGPRTHGQSDRERAPGSIGQTTTPGRVYKGKRMAGRMGGERVTIKNLKIIDVREDGILLKGLIPGAKGGLVEVIKN